MKETCKRDVYIKNWVLARSKVVYEKGLHSLLYSDFSCKTGTYVLSSLLNLNSKNE